MSVLMVAYNAEKTIGEAIESVLKHSFADFEFIIVNDTSTDNTLPVINSYDDKRIHLIDCHCQDNIQSLNTGIKASTGKYIALMESDGIMHIDRLKLQYVMMEDFPDITICSSWRTVFGKRMPKRIEGHKLAGWIELPLVQLLLDDIMINPTYTIRRSFISEHRLFYDINYRSACDYKLWTEVASLNGGFYIDTQPLVFRRISDTKISRKRRQEQLQTIVNIKKEILPALCNKYAGKYPVLLKLYNSYCELLEQQLISENYLFTLFYSHFMKNKDTFKNLK